MEGQDLSVILEGREPEKRPHFSLGYDKYVWTRDESYAMFGRNDGSEARLYDLRSDPAMDRDVAGERPDLVRQMFEGYVLKDADGALPTY